MQYWPASVVALPHILWRFVVFVQYIAWLSHAHPVYPIFPGLHLFSV